MDKLRCVVERVTYENEETGYTVIKVRAKGYSDLIAVVGNLSAVTVGSVLTVQGEWKVDGKYGRQFIASQWEETLPATALAIEKYLGGGLIKGIGPQFAKKIVAQFQEGTLQVIEDEPDRLIEVEGIGRKRIEMIKKAWQEQKEIKNVMLFLQEHGVSAALATKIYKQYGNDSIAVVRENPYRLADDIWGIGFRTADALAAKLGIDKESFIRCRSGILYTLNELSNEGHCYATQEQLIAKALELLGIEEPKLVMTLDHMRLNKDVIAEEDAIYLPPLFFCEQGASRRVREIMSASRAKHIINQAVSSELRYNAAQSEAIQRAAEAKFMTLTGGPGTGKTTVTKGIIRLFEQNGFNILLAAPTGRAAKRMTETTGKPAKTIHRLLEYKPPQGYQKNEDAPLEGDVLIVDEASMIDIVLMYNLLKAVPPHMTVILVGDIDQLPSVGPGNVLRDIIDSEVVPVVRLTKIFRQAAGSMIIQNAHRINRGDFPVLSSGRQSDFFYMEGENTALPDLIVDLCARRLPRAYSADPIKDIQVLCPMQRGETGAAHLNEVLQGVLNKSQLSLRRGGVEYRLGDKVMQIRNNYDKDIFNGDIGTVTKIDIEERTLEVTFDGRPVPYDLSETDELVLAYACTIHKSQGSEYPIVVMPLTMSHYVMLERNLLYTGITRAKKILVLLGEKRAIAMAVKNNNVTRRNTRFSKRLQDAKEARN
jgi:exodeoxyribonuclease V alpha subunit